MPETPFRHFEEDITRARSLLTHARGLGQSPELRDDVLRSAWMLAVGAMDAFFCDTYAHLLARSLQARQTQKSVRLPDRFQSIEVPVAVVFAPYHKSINWRWRKAARAIVERDSVLSLGRVHSLFNPFFRENAKFYDGVLDDWISKHPTPGRMFGISYTQYAALRGQSRHDARKRAKEKLSSRFEQIIQRRHDCIHNCDRPKHALLRILPGTVEKVIVDIGFFVSQCNSHIDHELPIFLTGIGCTGTTLNRLR